MQNSIYGCLNMSQGSRIFVKSFYKSPIPTDMKKFQWSHKLQTFWTPQMQFLVFEFQEIWNLLNALLRYALFSKDNLFFCLNSLSLVGVWFKPIVTNNNEKCNNQLNIWSPGTAHCSLCVTLTRISKLPMHWSDWINISWFLFSRRTGSTFLHNIHIWT